MKIAITAQGRENNSEIDPRFGRARYILIADSASSEMQVIDNSQNAQAAQGAGIQTARSVAQAGAEALISGHVGPKAFAVLQAANIKIYQMSAGTVAQGLEAFHSGKLQPVSQPNVEGHWA